MLLCGGALTFGAGLWLFNAIDRIEHPDHSVDPPLMLANLLVVFGLALLMAAAATW